MKAKKQPPDVSTLFTSFWNLKKWIHSCSRCHRELHVSHPHPKSVNSILSIASWSIAIYCFLIGGIHKLPTHIFRYLGQVSWKFDENWDFFINSNIYGQPMNLVENLRHPARFSYFRHPLVQKHRHLALLVSVRFMLA